MGEVPPRGEWTEDMDQISGFGQADDPGGWRYENCCRAMLKTGLAWLDAHPDAELQYRGYSHVIGVIVEENEDAKALSAALLAPAEHGGGASGAMHQAVVGHLLFIRRNGWEEWVRLMRWRKELGSPP